jgi:hypothetical protein
MKPKRNTLLMALAISVVCGFSVSLAQAKPEPNPLKNVYFGEQHMHTRNSFDAFTAGVSATWDDAYNFAKGKEIKLSTTGTPIKRRTPYDFVAITDHSEYYGVLKEFANPKSELSKSDFAKQVYAGVKDPSKAGPAVQKLIQTLVKSEPLAEYITPELRQGMWQKFLETADMFPLVDSAGNAISKQYAQTRMGWEPLYEATQMKGDDHSGPHIR